MYTEGIVQSMTVVLFAVVSGSDMVLASMNETLQLSRPAQSTATPFFLFPDKYQPENIKPRSNGQLLVTVNTVPELWQIDPFKNQSGNLVYRFKGCTSLFGIVETSIEDIFHLVTSNFTGAPNYYGSEGSVSIFEVDLRDSPGRQVVSSAVKVSKVMDVPHAQLLDGLATINRSAGLLMSGDAQTGEIYLIDTHKRSATALLQDATMNGTSRNVTSGLAHIGINGIKFHDGNLYFTNTAKGLYGKLPLNRTTGEPTGAPSVVEEYNTYLDDLSFDTMGDQYISVPLTGIYRRTPDSPSIKSHTSLLVRLYGANSNTRGRTARDKRILYSTFNGAPSGIARISLERDRLQKNNSE